MTINTSIKSAFQAVYLVAFLLAIESLFWFLFPDAANWSGKTITDNSVNSILLCWLMRIFLILICIHWVRLYISLELMEDILVANPEAFFPNWNSLTYSNIYKFFEFLCRCAMVGLIGFKAISPVEIDKISDIFLFLSFLYGVMVVWGALYTICQYRAGALDNIKVLEKYTGLRKALKYALGPGYMALTVPSFGTAVTLHYVIPSASNQNFLIAAILLVITILFFAYHLIWDAFKSNSQSFNISSSEPDRTKSEPDKGNLRVYLIWLYNRISPHETRFVFMACLVSLFAILVLDGAIFYRQQGDHSVPIAAKLFFISSILSLSCLLSVMFSNKASRSWSSNIFRFVFLLSLIGSILSTVSFIFVFIGDGFPFILKLIIYVMPVITFFPAIKIDS